MDHRSAMSAEVDCGWKVKVVESESDKKTKNPPKSAEPLLSTEITLAPHSNGCGSWLWVDTEETALLPHTVSLEDFHLNILKTRVSPDHKVMIIFHDIFFIFVIDFSSRILGKPQCCVWVSLSPTPLCQEYFKFNLHIALSLMPKTFFT